MMIQFNVPQLNFQADDYDYLPALLRLNVLISRFAVDLDLTMVVLCFAGTPLMTVFC